MINSTRLRRERVHSLQKSRRKLPDPSPVRSAVLGSNSLRLRIHPSSAERHPTTLSARVTEATWGGRQVCFLEAASLLEVHSLFHIQSHVCLLLSCFPWLLSRAANCGSWVRLACIYLRPFKWRFLTNMFRKALRFPSRTPLASNQTSHLFCQTRDRWDTRRRHRLAGVCSVDTIPIYGLTLQRSSIIPHPGHLEDLTIVTWMSLLLGVGWGDRTSPMEGLF